MLHCHVVFVLTALSLVVCSLSSRLEHKEQELEISWEVPLDRLQQGAHDFEKSSFVQETDEGEEVNAAIHSHHASTAWSCPSGIDVRVCDAIKAADQRTATNCGEIDNAILEAVGMKTVAGFFPRVEVAKQQELSHAFKPTWVRVHTGAAHEYLVEHVGNEYRIYQANAEGPLDIKEWMSTDEGFDFLPEYAEALYQFRDTGRWTFMFHQLPNTPVELHDWWAGVLHSAAANKAAFVQAIGTKYLESRRLYGGGRLLTLDELQLFMQTPLQVGGGSAPLQSTAGAPMLSVEQYSGGDR